MSSAFQCTVKLRIRLQWLGGDGRNWTERYEADTQIYGGTFTTDTPYVSHPSKHERVDGNFVSLVYSR